MKFSNFVSTLAVVSLAFNADALRVQSEDIYWRNSSKKHNKALFLENDAYNLDPIEAHDVCLYAIDYMIRP